jgi:hypothetical protein
VLHPRRGVRAGPGLLQLRHVPFERAHEEVRWRGGPLRSRMMQPSVRLVRPQDPCARFGVGALTLDSPPLRTSRKAAGWP